MKYRWLCETCNKKYTTDRDDIFKCPLCKEILILDKIIKDEEVDSSENLELKENQINTEEENGTKKFRWICNKCKSIYTSKDEGVFKCPSCDIELTPIKAKLEMDYFYICKHCKTVYKRKKIGLYDCPECGRNLQLI